MNFLKDKFDDAKEKVCDFKDDAVDFVQDKVEDVKDKIEDVKDKIEEVKDKLDYRRLLEAVTRVTPLQTIIHFPYTSYGGYLVKLSKCCISDE